jgi:hypothetical protein
MSDDTLRCGMKLSYHVSGVLPQHLPAGTDIATKSFRIASLRTEVRIEDIPEGEQMY